MAESLGKNFCVIALTVHKRASRTSALPAAVASDVHALPHGGMALCHYWMPIASGWSAAMVIQRGNGCPFSPAGLLLFLSCIGCAYGWDRLFDAPLARRRTLRLLLSVGTIASALIAGVALWQLSFSTLKVVLLLGGVTLAYPWLKRVPLLKNLLVALVWVVAATLFPFAEGGAFPWSKAWLAIALPLWVLWVAACLLCDVKDEEDDRAATVCSLPTLVGTLWACRIAAVLAGMAGWLALWHGRAGVAIASLLLMALACFPRLLKQKALGPLVVDAVLVVPGLFLVLKH